MTFVSTLALNPRFAWNPPCGWQMPLVQQTKAVLSILANSAAFGMRAEEVIHIVQCYSLISRNPFYLPRWRDIAERHKFILHSGYADLSGVNYALTFNLSDLQRQDWVASFGNVTRGFKKIVLEPLRNTLGDDMIYWFYVEPKKSRMPDIRDYKDSPGEPRRFDVHGALKIPDSRDDEVMRKVQCHIWKNALHLRLSMRREKFPLWVKGRMAWMPRLYGFQRWHRYSSKALRNTRKYHCDVVGERPMGVSRKLQQEASSYYDELYQLFRERVPDMRMVALAGDLYAQMSLRPVPPYPSRVRAASDAFARLRPMLVV